MPGSVLLIDDHVVIAQAMADALRGAGYDPVEYVGEDAFGEGFGPPSLRGYSENRTRRSVSLAVARGSR